MLNRYTTGPSDRILSYALYCVKKFSLMNALKCGHKDFRKREVGRAYGGTPHFPFSGYPLTCFAHTLSNIVYVVGY